MNAYSGYGSCGSRPSASANIASIVGAIQQIRLGSNQYQQQSVMKQVPSQIDTQTRGVTYPSAIDEKHAHDLGEKVEIEELPSYEASTGMTVRNLPPQQPPMQEVKAVSTIPGQPSNRIVTLGLEHFNTGLEAYRHGDNRAAKRAAKSFVKDLYSQEMERRRAGKGYLACGERQQIKRDLRPIKEMMKEAVREAKMERRMLGRA